MDCFVNKIFSGVSDDSVHLQFQKFSKGTFTNRALIKVTASAKGYALAAGNEFANELVREVATKLGSAKTQVNGVIVSTQNMDGKLPSSGKKQFMGIKQYVIDGEMSGDQILGLQKQFPEAFFALTFNAGDTILKIKPKAPKSAKPKTSEAPPKADFCSLKTTDLTLVKSFIHEDGWKSLEANHSFVITEIILPQGVTDLNEIRRLAKRKGKLIRKRIIDGKESTVEKEFTA